MEGDEATRGYVLEPSSVGYSACVVASCIFRVLNFPGSQESRNSLGWISQQRDLYFVFSTEPPENVSRING
jgi:hypothetical protein